MYSSESMVRFVHFILKNYQNTRIYDLIENLYIPSIQELDKLTQVTSDKKSAMDQSLDKVRLSLNNLITSQVSI